MMASHSTKREIKTMNTHDDKLKRLMSVGKLSFWNNKKGDGVHVSIEFFYNDINETGYRAANGTTIEKAINVLFKAVSKLVPIDRDSIK